ncbi:MAG: hypothetical protein ABSH14_04890 [Verrucomicrobiia bacterium]|jgi:hypothetical protein
MKNYVRLSLISLIAFCLAGCATYTIQPVSARKLDKQWNSGDAEKGYVFYQPELYFLVTPVVAPKSPSNNVSTAKPDSSADSSAAFSVTPIYLPNPNKPYRVTTFNFLAKSDFAFNFKDGWQLSSIADKADNTTIANTIAGELKTILGAGGLSMMSLAPSPSTKERKAFLLHPIYNPDTGIITDFSVIYLPEASK